MSHVCDTVCQCCVGVQGPLENTCGDFWLMVWQQNTKAVVMLNRVIEKGTVSFLMLAVVEWECSLWGREREWTGRERGDGGRNK